MFFEAKADFGLILDLDILSTFLFLEFLHKLINIRFFSIQAVKVHKKCFLHFNPLDLFKLDIIEELPLWLLYISKMEEVIENHIVKFETLCLIDRETEHVLKYLGDIVFDALVSHYEDLVAAELGGSDSATWMLGHWGTRKKGPQVVVIEGHYNKRLETILVWIFFNQSINSLWEK